MPFIENGKKQHENTEYFAMLRRMLIGGKKHNGQGGAVKRASVDIDALPELVELQQMLEQAARDSVANLRAQGYSWADIGHRLGCSRQAAQQRYGKKAKR